MRDVRLWVPAAAALFAWVALTRLGKVSSLRAHDLVEAGARLIRTPLPIPRDEPGRRQRPASAAIEQPCDWFIICACCFTC
jgi:hypothetical protein